jgi:Ulp1 family protease
MGSTHQTVVDILLRWVEDELKDKKQQVLDRSEWSRAVHGRDVPQQTNSDDCGMFLCKFADFIARGARLNFSSRHMNYFRARMAHELLMKRVS